MKKSILLSCALLALAAASFAAPRLWRQLVPQEPGPSTDERRAAQIERIKRAQEEILRQRKDQHVKTLRGMQGAWQLVQLISSGLQDEGREDAGFLLVGDEFLSIEIHMGYFDEQHRERSSFIQTGIYRLNFSPEGDLMAMCLIGSVDDGSGLTAPQEPGLLSTYNVVFGPAGQLFMTSGDGSRFEFERVSRGALTDRLYEETDWLPGAETRSARKKVLEAAAKNE